MRRSNVYKSNASCILNENVYVTDKAICLSKSKFAHSYMSLIFERCCNKNNPTVFWWTSNLGKDRGGNRLYNVILR